MSTSRASRSTRPPRMPRQLGAVSGILSKWSGAGVRAATRVCDASQQWVQPLIPPPALRTALVIACVFVLDWIAPLGVAIGVAYIAAVISAAQLRSSSAIFWTAGVCSGLLAVGWGLSPSAGNMEIWKVVLNEFLGLTAIWASAGVASSWKSLRQRREKDLRDNRLLQQASALAVAAHSVEEALQNCVNILCDITGWPVGHAYVPDPAHQRLMATRIWRMSDPEAFSEFRRMTEGRALAPGECLAGRVWVEQRPIWTIDYRRERGEYRQALPDADAVVGAFCFPVMVGEGVAAVLEFLAPQASAPDPDTLLLISRVGDELGAHLERRRFQEERSRLAAVVDSSYDAIIAKDLRGLITSWNKGAETVYGYSADEVIGRSGAFLGPSDGAADSTEIVDVLKHGHSSRHFETQRRRKDGSLVDVSITISPLLDGEGQIVGTSTIERDITLRKQREQELERAKEAAEAASRAKSEFVANISHELRTPMNAILGMLDLTRRSEGLSPHLRDYLDTAHESADLLLSLLNDLLDFSRMESGRFELDQAPFRLRETLDEAIRILALRAHEQGLELTCHVATAVPDFVEGDSRRLRQILMNLVGNAIKFTSEGEIVVRVDVESRHADSIHLLIKVRDTGIGIEPQHQDAIFDPFTQADASSTRRFSGSGLGLTIVRELVEKMDGRIWLHSEVGVGSEFCCTLQLKVLDDSAVPELELTREALAGMSVIVADDNASNRELLRETLAQWNIDVTTVCDGASALKALQSRDGQPSPLLMIDSQMPDMGGLEVIDRAAHAERPPLATILMRTTSEPVIEAPADSAPDLIVDKPLSQSTILDSLVTVLDGRPRRGERSSISVRGASAHSLDLLIVEDTPANQKVLLAILANRGHHATVVQNGREAVEAVGKHRYDVVLMDVQMPVMNGLEATRRIRRLDNPELARTPIVALTAHAMPADRLGCQEAGMSGYLAKPIDADEMIRLVERLAGEDTADSDSPSTIPSSPAAMSEQEQTMGQPSPTETIRIEPALERLGGDRGLLAEIARFFVEDAPQLLEELQAALERGDSESTARAAHSLKGLASNFDAMAAMELARTMEQAALRNELDAVQERLPEMRSQVATVSEALREQLLSD